MRNILRREEITPEPGLEEGLADLLRKQAPDNTGFGQEERIPEEARVRFFKDLPTRELDEIVEAAGKEYEALKMECQQIRNAYIYYTELVAKRVQLLREGMRLSMETMKQLRDQCEELNEPPTPAFFKPKETKSDLRDIP